MTSLDLTGRTAIITGASRGIGLAIAQQLATAGADVVLTARKQEAAEAAAAQVGEKALGVGAHAVDEDAARRCVELTLERFGGIDILVNNAGLGWAGPVGETPAAKVTELATVNLAAPIELTTLLVPGMIGRGRGGVVFVSSIAGVTGVRGEALYAATKAGLATFAESLGYELHGHGVGVSVIVPAVIDTPFFSRRGRPYGRSRPAPVPAGRVATAIVSALEHGRPVVYVPRWMRIPAWLHGAAPGTFRALAARFGDPGY
jgi:short-subunit dehydrogenase